MSRVWKQLIVPMTLAAMPHFATTAAFAKETAPKGAATTKTAAPKAAAVASESAADKDSAPEPKKGAKKDSGGASADVCIGDKVKEELETCPPGPALTGRPKDPSITFHGKVEELKKGDKELKASLPSEQMNASFRDLRKTKLQQRALSLLITEIQQLESLYKTTENTSKDRVVLLRRLAEDYVELENAAFREKTQAEIEVDDLKKTNPTAAGQKKAIAVARTKTMQGARTAAIKYYKTLLEDYSGVVSPRFPKAPAPTYALLDEVYYYLAYEYEQASDFVNARSVYLDLIQKAPNSKYVVAAYFAFGDLFFNEAQADPSKWKPAREAYEKVVAKPPPDNKYYGPAWYKLAYVFWQTGELARSLDAFKKTIDYGTQYPTLPGAPKLAESARKDIVPVYALAGAPEQAYNFFKTLSGDTNGANSKTLAMENDLGTAYLDTGHYPEVITLYTDLLTRDSSGENTCLYQNHITEAVMAKYSADKARIVGELDKQLKRALAYKNENHSPEAKQTCANHTAAMLTETAMLWNIEAIGSAGGQRGTNDPRTMDLSSALYKKVVETWTADEYSKFEFPRLVKEDWPTIPGLKYMMADLLYYRQKWADCGPAFDAVVKENPAGPKAAEAAYAAVLCYENVYLASHGKGTDKKGTGNLPGVGKDTKAEADEKYAAKQMTPPQKAMVESFSRYACYIHPDEKDTDGQKQLVDVKFHRARAYWEAQMWEKASAGFREIAFNYPEHESGVYAAMLYLESINTMIFHGQPKRPACIEDMNADVPKFIELYCTGDKLAKNSDSCMTLTKVQCDISRLRAQHMVDEGNKGPPNAMDLFAKGGQAYYDVWEKYGATPLKAGQPAQCDKLDEVLSNAAKAWQAGRLLLQSIRAKRVLIDPAYHMETSELAKDAMFQIGGNYQVIQVYDSAADWYEKYAKAFPHRSKGDQALSDAIVLRLGLGQEEEALEDVKLYRANYGNSNPTQTAKVAFSLGAHYADKEDWDRAKKYLKESMASLGKAGPDIRIQAHATLARALRSTKAVAEARGEYATVLKLWGDGAEVQKEIATVYAKDDPAQRDRYLGKTLEAVGEALFYAAEDKKHEIVDPITYPVYKGAGNRDDITKYMKDKLSPWVMKKKTAIETADKEYQKVTALQPIPPPKWVIAAASRAGLMWGNFFDEFGKAPTPKEWNQFPEVKMAYQANLDEQRMPLKERLAKPALKLCLDKSVKFQYFDNFSRDCEKWLAKNYKTEYHVVDELHGGPTLSNSGLEDSQPPLTPSGQLWHAVDTGPATEKAEVVGAENAETAPVKKTSGKK